MEYRPARKMTVPVALVGDTATAAERDMSHKAHCIDAGLRHQIGEPSRQRVHGFLRLC